MPSCTCARQKSRVSYKWKQSRILRYLTSHKKHNNKIQQPMTDQHCTHTRPRQHTLHNVSQKMCHFRCSYLKTNNTSKSEGTRKVKYAYHFWKCAHCSCYYPKLSKLVQTCLSKLQLANLLAHFLKTQCIYRWQIQPLQSYPMAPPSIFFINLLYIELVSDNFSISKCTKTPLWVFKKFSDQPHHSAAKASHPRHNSGSTNAVFNVTSSWHTSHDYNDIQQNKSTIKMCHAAAKSRHSLHGKCSCC